MQMDLWVRRRGVGKALLLSFVGASLVACSQSSPTDDGDASGEGGTNAQGGMGGIGGGPGVVIEWPDHTPLAQGGAPIGTERPMIETATSDETSPSVGRKIKRVPRPEQDCVPGTYACACTDNHTCKTGMDCIEGICGDVVRWGDWTEQDLWPIQQELLWGSGSDEDSMPADDGGVWQ